MSLSGWRPALVTSLSSTNFDPALGPRLTTSMPMLPGSSSRVTVSSSSASPADSTGMNVIVVSSPCGPRAAPQDEQKLAPGGFLCPHWLQYTALEVTQ